MSRRAIRSTSGRAGLSTAVVLPQVQPCRRAYEYPQAPTPVCSDARHASSGGIVGVRAAVLPCCDHLFYPPQDWCPRCLHGETRYAPDSGRATVVSMTALAISFDAAWKRGLATHVACVRTLSGVSLFALADEALAAGADLLLSVSPATTARTALARAILAAPTGSIRELTVVGWTESGGRADFGARLDGSNMHKEDAGRVILDPSEAMRLSCGPSKSGFLRRTCPPLPLPN